MAPFSHLDPFCSRGLYNLSKAPLMEICPMPHIVASLPAFGISLLIPCKGPDLLISLSGGRLESGMEQALSS